MQFPFDATKVDPAKPLEGIPGGWYAGDIAASEVKPTKANDGAYLNLELTCRVGPYAGRKVFARLNVHNKNPVAQEIAYKELSAICHATGVLQIQDTAQLHGKPLEFKVTVDAEGRNDVAAYRAYGSGKSPADNGANGAGPAFAPPAPAAFTPPPPPPAAAPAWAPPAAAPAAPAAAPAWAPPAAPAPAAAPAAPWGAPAGQPAAGAAPWGAPAQPAAPAAAPGAAPPWATR